MLIHLIYNLATTWNKSRIFYILRNQDGLTFTFSQHVLVCVVSNGVQMGWAFSTLLTTIESYDDVTVDLQPFVWVDTDTEKTRVCL